MNKNQYPKTIYHYGDSNTFYGIISNKNLWLSNAFETNDFLERKWIDPILQEILTNLGNGHPQEHVNTFRNSVLTDYKMNRELPPFFIGFSEEGDLLSQWRGYANDGTGFSIGFNPEYFQIDRHIPLPNAIPDNTIGILPMIYDKSLIYDNVSKTIENYLNKFKSADYAQNSPAMIECTGTLVRIASCSKNPAFSEEKEWRILYTPIITIDKSTGFLEVKGKFTDMKFRVRRNMITSYFELPFGIKKDVPPINEIVLGPKNNTSIGTLGDFLARNELFNIKISKSKLSYR